MGNIDHKRLQPVRRIITLTGEHFKVTSAEIIGPSRVEAIAWARHVAMGLAREFTELTLDEIGQGFGARNFSTVRHCIHALNNRCETNARAREAVELLRRKVIAELQTAAPLRMATV